MVEADIVPINKESEISVKNGQQSPLKGNASFILDDIYKDRRRVNDLVDDLVAITNLLISEQKKNYDLEKQNKWLRESGKIILDYRKWWWQFLPLSWQRRKRDQRLREKGLFDKDAYVNRYPDVDASGQDPLRHYLYHGLAENRHYN